MRATCSVQKDL